MSKSQTKGASTSSVSKQSVYSRLNTYFSSKKMKPFLIVLLTGIVLAVINFNARISEAHDDSMYIEGGYRYVHEFPNYFYTANAPLYPMFLGLLTIVFGINLVVYKLFSIIFFVTGAILYYKALDKKIPEVLRYFVLVFICTNHLIVYYSSQTFSEAFYMLVQSVFFYFFLNYNFGENQFTNNLKTDYKKWLVIGLLMLLLTLAKNILIVGIAAIVLYYLIKKDYRKAFFSVASFGIFKILFEIIKKLIWGASAIQYQTQATILMYKDPYDATQGQEDMWGFVGRFTDNVGLYLGKRFYQIMGFMNEDSDKVSYFLAFIILGLTFYGLYRAIKDKKHIISFLILFSGTVSFGTFLVLQARWDQARFIMVHMPSILLGIFYGLYRLFEKDNFSQRILIAILFLLSGSFLISTVQRGFKNLPIVSKNLKGDIYYGYTPDWQNYLRLSTWCKDSLPETSYVACRKAPMSFVYGRGKHFYPIYSVIAKDTTTQQSNPDSALAIFKKNKVTHIIIASLRMNPRMNTGDIINTIHNVVGPIMKKYPDKLKMIKQFGDSEPAYLFRIDY